MSLIGRALRVVVDTALLPVDMALDVAVAVGGDSGDGESFTMSRLKKVANGTGKVIDSITGNDF